MSKFIVQKLRRESNKGNERNKNYRTNQSNSRDSKLKCKDQLNRGGKKQEEKQKLQLKKKGRKKKRGKRLKKIDWQKNNESSKC